MLGHSVEGRAIHGFWLGRGPDRVVLLATIHGTEPTGAVLLKELSSRLRRRPELLAGRTVVVVPIVNPDGVRSGSRYNANGIDINRNFPTPNRENKRPFGSSALTEPEAQALYELIEDQNPARIITIHQPLECIDYDGPARELARAIADSGELDVKRLGTRRGSLGAYAGEVRGIPTVTLELRESDRDLSRDQLWQRYGQALLTAVTFTKAADSNTI